MATMGRLDDARRRGSGFRAISALVPRDQLLRRGGRGTGHEEDEAHRGVRGPENSRSAWM